MFVFKIRKFRELVSAFLETSNGYWHKGYIDKSSKIIYYENSYGVKRKF